MPHRVHKRKKVVEVGGDVDLSTIWRKVEAHGGPEGWTVRGAITDEEFTQIVMDNIDEIRKVVMAEDGEEPRVVIKGFQQPGEHQVFAENNLLHPNPDEEDTDRDGATPKVT